jgi:serine/alanine racemase
VTERASLEKTNFNSVDLMKLFAAVLVLIIHTSPLSFNFWLDAGVGLVTRIAVPFFFVSSSFLFFRKNPGKEQLIKFIKRNLLIYLCWSVLYFPKILNAWLKDQRVDIVEILEFIKDAFLNGTYGLLWFFPALIFGVALVYLLMKVLKNPKTIFAIALGFLVIGMVFSTYYALFENVGFIKIIQDGVMSKIGTRNGLFYGFAYIAMGALISRNETFKLKKRYFLFLALSLALLCCEGLVAIKVLGTNATILWISVLPMTYSVFKIVVAIKLPDNSFYVTARKMSILIYTSQYLFIPTIQSWVASAIQPNSLQNIIVFFGATLVCAVFSILIIWLSKKKYLGVLQYLY